MRALDSSKDSRSFDCSYVGTNARAEARKGGKGFFYYRSSTLSLPLPTLMLLLSLQSFQWEESLPVVGAQSLLCRLGSLRPRSSGSVLALPWHKLSWWHLTNILPVYIPESVECFCPARLYFLAISPLPLYSLSLNIIYFCLWYIIINIKSWKSFSLVINVYLNQTIL